MQSGGARGLELRTAGLTVGLGDMAQKIITIIIFISVDIDNYHDKCRIMIINDNYYKSLKPDFCSKVKVLEPDH